MIPVVEEYFSTGGAAAWRDRFVDHAQGLRVIGTEDGEWLSGEAAFAVFADPSAHVDPMPSVVLSDLEAYEHGGTGWVACRPLLSLPDGSTLTLRWTAVFERTGPSWTLRQLHVSRG
ncbi:MAG: nuclear transport factor 2 family protein [Acidimicrobiia bacterium]